MRKLSLITLTLALLLNANHLFAQNEPEIRFFNSLGIVPNGLELKLMNGQTEKFVVNGRKQWREEIERQRNRT